MYSCSFLVVILGGLAALWYGPIMSPFRQLDSSTLAFCLLSHVSIRAPYPLNNSKSLMEWRKVQYDSIGAIMKYSKVVTYDVLSRSNIHRFRVYAPPEVRSGPSRPVLLWLHGGGFVLGSIEADEAKCRQLANTFNILVVSVEYRLAPEYPYPAAAHDAYDAIMWTLYHIAEYNGDLSRLIIAGEDAGGHLALAATLRYIQAKSPSLPPLYGLVLIYPLLQPTQDLESYRQYAYMNAFLSTSQHRHFWNMYVNSTTTNDFSVDQICNDEDVDTALCPLLLPPQLLRRFPATLLVRATHDVVADEGLRFINLLTSNYIPTTTLNYTSIHGFMGFPRLGNDTIHAVGTWVQQLGTTTVAKGRSNKHMNM